METLRYWYHVSDSLTKSRVRLKPRKEGVNRCYEELKVPRVCVAPTIEQCLVAIPYSPYGNLRVYRTLRKVRAEKSIGIVDAPITKEHWITKEVSWIQVGTLRLGDFKAPPECATDCDNKKKVRSTLKRWRKGLVKKHLSNA